MKTITRLVLGVVSSLLVSAGFYRAAGRLDPLFNVDLSSGQPDLSGPSCIAPCYYTPRPAGLSA
jgi:hypothetical protein